MLFVLVGCVLATVVPSSQRAAALPRPTPTPAIAQVRTPTVHPHGGTFFDAVTVILGTPTPNATIRYTLDGSDPATSASVLIYQEAFRLQRSARVRAIATSQGATPSEYVDARFEVVPSSSVRWTDVAAPNGEDDTATVQRALDAGGNIRFPDGTYVVRPLFMASNTVLMLSPGTVLRAKAGGYPGLSDSLLNLARVEDVTIYGNGARIEMLREEYTDGEWRMGVSTRSSRDVYIERLASNGSGGDGFYIGTARPEPGKGRAMQFSGNITLVDVTAGNNKRLGLAIVSGKNIGVTGSRFHDTQGAWPQGGIDIEPNTRFDEVEGVVLENIETHNNRAYGIVIALAAMGGSKKTIDITIRNHRDTGSLGGLQILNIYKPLDGQITVTDAAWTGSRAAGFWARNYPINGPRVDLIQPVVTDSNSTSPSEEPYKLPGPPYNGYAAAFAVTWHADRRLREVGNIHFERPRVVETRTPPRTLYGFVFYDPRRPFAITDIDLIDPEFVGVPPERRVFFYGNGTLSDGDGALVKQLVDDTTAVGQTAASSVPPAPTYVLFHNQSATVTRTLELGQVPVGHPPITVEVRASAPLRVVPAKGIRITRERRNVGKYIESDVQGSVLRLEKIGPREWSVVEEQGQWTAAIQR
jgi:hypothetical protein